MLGKIVTREGLCKNERAVIHAINHVGSRVSMNVLNLHVLSLYAFMEIPIDGSKVAYCFEGVCTFSNYIILCFSFFLISKVVLPTCKLGSCENASRSTMT